MELTGEQLKKAEIQLKKYSPQSLMVYGYLVQINRAHVRPDHVKVFVDRWPEFSVIICRPHTEQKGVSFSYTFVFANDEVILLETMRKPSVIDYTSDPRIGINLHHSDILKMVASDRNLTCKTLALLCHVMILEDVSNLPSIDSSGVSLSALDESHTALLNQTWKFSNDRTAGMIRNMLASFPSYCVLDAEGKPVSWVLTYIHGSFGMLYTLPEHRGKGYAKVLVSAMAKRLHSEGRPIFCVVEEENKISYRLMKNLGFVEDPSFRETRIGFSDV